MFSTCASMIGRRLLSPMRLWFVMNSRCGSTVLDKLAFHLWLHIITKVLLNTHGSRLNHLHLVWVSRWIHLNVIEWLILWSVSACALDKRLSLWLVVYYIITNSATSRKYLVRIALLTLGSDILFLLNGLVWIHTAHIRIHYFVLVLVLRSQFFLTQYDSLHILIIVSWSHI